MSGPAARAGAPRLAPLWWAIGLALVAALVAGTLAPPQDLPQVADLLPDKAEHFGGYFALALWFGGLVRRSRYAVLAAVLLALGGSLELAQYQMHVGRAAEWLDMLANACGVAVGIGLAMAGLARWPLLVEHRLGLARGAP